MQSCCKDIQAAAWVARPFFVILSHGCASARAPPLYCRCLRNALFISAPQTARRHRNTGKPAGVRAAWVSPASTAARQRRKNINLFVTDSSSFIRTPGLMFYLLAFCRIRCGWRAQWMLCGTNRPYCWIRGGRVRWRSSQCGTHLCCLWMDAMHLYGPHPWTASTATYNMREFVMRLLICKREKRALYTWAKKSHFFLMSAWRNVIEGHYQTHEYIPETVYHMKCPLDYNKWCTQKKNKHLFICYSKRREMNTSDPDHGHGNELAVQENGHRGPQTMLCSFICGPL